MDKYSLFTLELFSDFLDKYDDSITREDIQRICDLGFSKEYAFALLISTMYNIDINENKQWFNEYLLPSIKCLNREKYFKNPYYKNIKIQNKLNNKWSLKWDKYKAYQAFVFNDFYIKDAKVLFNIGFFEEEFKYPAIYENDRLWMSITPNEIETMNNSINEARGNVLVLGLGIAYYPYMLSLKENVDSITIIEKSKEAIQLFKEEIYPKFTNKIVNIIEMDAFEYLENVDENINYIFADLWHDVSDGKELYLKIKEYEKKYRNIKFSYWIEDTIKFYL